MSFKCGYCGRSFEGKRRGSFSVRYCNRTCAGRAKGRSAIGIASDGRAYISLRDGTRRHWARCLMEGYLKRELAPDEIVHHINGDRSDDRLENLEVLSKSDHTRLHTLEAWSRGPQGPAKLTAEQVRLIRASDETTGAVLVRRFGVSEAAISMIRHEKTWKNVA